MSRHDHPVSIYPPVFDGPASFTGDLNVGSNTRTFTKIFINGQSGTTKDVQFLSAGVRRWVVESNGVAETGADVGSNFAILARHDDGTAIDVPLEIARAAGGVIELRRPTIFSVNNGVFFTNQTSAAAAALGTLANAPTAGNPFWVRILVNTVAYAFPAWPL